MTLPYERSLAVKAAENFLVDLLAPKTTPRVPRAIRERARRILRHYPSAYHIEQVKWGDEYVTNPAQK